MKSNHIPMAIGLVATLLACTTGCETPEQVQQKVQAAYIQGIQEGREEGFIDGKEAGRNETIADLATVAASTINGSIRWAVGGFAVLALVLILTVRSMLSNGRPNSSHDYAMQRELLLLELKKEMALIAAQHAALPHRR